VVENQLSVVPSTYNTNTCLNQFGYTPTFLTMSTTYNFNYPILQAMGCFGNRFELRCPVGQLIRIYAAYYGLQPATNLNYCATNPSGGPTLCYRPDSFVRIMDQCENTTACSITASTFNFGDPCLGYANKQYLIQYQCVDTPVLASTISQCKINSTGSSICPALTDPVNQKEELWCDPTVMSIECDPGKVIMIRCAWYGIDANIKCSGFTSGAPVCYSQSSYDLVYSTCNGQNSCTFDGKLFICKVETELKIT
jgi:hypothetical protein